MDLRPGRSSRSAQTPLVLCRMLGSSQTWLLRSRRSEAEDQSDDMTWRPPGPGEAAYKQLVSTGRILEPGGFRWALEPTETPERSTQMIQKVDRKKETAVASTPATGWNEIHNTSENQSWCLNGRSLLALALLATLKNLSVGLYVWSTMTSDQETGHRLWSALQCLVPSYRHLCAHFVCLTLNMDGVNSSSMDRWISTWLGV